jgi:hypothetical protein
MRPYATSVCGLELAVYEALSYLNLWLDILARSLRAGRAEVYEALSYWCMRP